MNFSLSFLVSFIALLPALVSAQPSEENDYGLCCMCGGCWHPIRGDLFITEDGGTCETVALEMAGLAQNSQRCREYKKNYRSDCCDRNANPIPVAQQEPEDFVPNLPQGDEPQCDICKDGGFPGYPKIVTKTLYMEGHQTCEQLYHMGNAGHILRRLCWPMQDAYQEPCGCGPFHPQWKGDSGGADQCLGFREDCSRDSDCCDGLTCGNKSRRCRPKKNRNTA